MTDPNVPNNGQQQPPQPPPPPQQSQQPPQYAQQPPQQYGQPPYAAAPAKKSPVLSIISLIAGIVGILFSWSGWVLLISIAAIVLGHMGKKKEPEAKGMWLTGLILGYVGAAINLIVFVITIIVAIAAMSAFGSLATY